MDGPSVQVARARPDPSVTAAARICATVFGVGSLVALVVIRRAAMSPASVVDSLSLRILAVPSRSGIIPRVTPTRVELDASLATIRERGWAMSDEMLSVGVRSIAAPVRDASGRTAAAMNVTVHAAETSIEHLVGEYLPLLLETAGAVSEEWSNLAMLPIADEQPPRQPPE